MRVVRSLRERTNPPPRANFQAIDEGGKFVDINAAIDAFSYQGGNRNERLRAICPDTATAEYLAAEITGLQERIYALVRAGAGPDGLPRAQVEEIARTFLATARPDIDRTGLLGLIRYVTWIARHDGWLRSESKGTETTESA